MLNISVVQNAMAAQIGRLAFPTLRTLGQYQDQINPPVGIVMPGRPYGKYAVVLEGASGFLGAPSLGNTASPHEISLDFLIVVSKASTLERVEQSLNLWIGFEYDSTAVSVPAAVMADPTLGGVVEWCLPTTVDPPGPLDWNGPEMMGTRIHFDVSVG